MATPKGRTLEMLGRLNPQTQKHEPFHLYSMRQAIEEGFIEDVLANYTTYQTFWKIEKKTEEDPEYDAKKARRAIARFVSLHPHHLAQKAEIIVEHFRAHTAKEMGGLAKAMVERARDCTPPARFGLPRGQHPVAEHSRRSGDGRAGVALADRGREDESAARNPA